MTVIDTVLNIFNMVWPVLVAILIFGLIIFIHEFGHFLFAKLFKVRVNQFAIGFGPAIFKFQKGETLYAIRILPFGGYCAMEGEDGQSEDPRAFGNAKVYKRIIICAAGAVFNLILGFLIMLTIVSIQSNELASTTISRFDDHAVSNTGQGLQVGDRILKINNRHIFSSDDISYMLASDEDGVVSMQVKRDGEKITLDRVQFNMQEQDGRSFIELDFWVEPVNAGFFGVIGESFNRTLSMGRLVWMSLGDLLTGKYGLNDISGPVGFTSMMSDAVSAIAVRGVDGLIYLLRILSLITINLGIFNLLPVPALDGSRILFLIIEWIRGKPIDPKKEGMVHAIGMAVLLVLMVVILFKDVWALF